MFRHCTRVWLECSTIPLWTFDWKKSQKSYLQWSLMNLNKLISTSKAYLTLIIIWVVKILFRWCTSNNDIGWFVFVVVLDVHAHLDMLHPYFRIIMRKYFAIIVDDFFFLFLFWHDFSFLGGGYRLLFVFGGKDIFIIGICGGCLWNL